MDQHIEGAMGAREIIKDDLIFYSSAEGTVFKALGIE